MQHKFRSEWPCELPTRVLVCFEVETILKVGARVLCTTCYGTAHSFTGFVLFEAGVSFRCLRAAALPGRGCQAGGS